MSPLCLSLFIHSSSQINETPLRFCLTLRYCDSTQSTTVGLKVPPTPGLATLFYSLRCVCARVCVRVRVCVCVYVCLSLLSLTRLCVSHSPRLFSLSLRLPLLPRPPPLPLPQAGRGARWLLTARWLPSRGER